MPPYYRAGMKAGYSVNGTCLIPYGAAENASHYPREFSLLNIGIPPPQNFSMFSGYLLGMNMS
jgi:hypothetical protein